MERFPKSEQEAEKLIQLADLLQDAARMVVGEWKKEEFPTSESANSFCTQDTSAILPSPALHQAQRSLLAAIGAISELVVEPCSRVQEVACQFFESRALFIAAERSIPDLLEEAGDDGIDIATLSQKTGIEKGKLSRILRCLCSIHIFREIENGRFGNNRISAALVKNEPLRAYVQLFNLDIYTASDHLPKYLLGNLGASYDVLETPFQNAVGTSKSRWDWLAEKVTGQELAPPSGGYPGVPDIGSWNLVLDKNGLVARPELTNFGRAMVGGGKLGAAQVFDYPWINLPKDALVVDVGGGIGGFVLQLLPVCPDLKYVIQDRPEVIEQARTEIWPREAPTAVVEGRVILMAHDFFEQNPVQGADIYWLRGIFATNQDQFEDYATVAIRIAMLVGMIVDDRNTAEEGGSFISFITCWHSEEDRKKMEEILANFSGAYISVFYDDNRATAIAPLRYETAIRKNLIMAGITTSPIALYGRFHWDGHREDCERLIEFCNSDKKYQFAQVSNLALPVWTNNGGYHLSQDPLHAEAIRSILEQPSKWYETFGNVYRTSVAENDFAIISFGPETPVPPSFMRSLGSRVVKAVPGRNEQREESDLGTQRANLATSIAVVGMSCKVAGAEDLEQFWKLLCKGVSQHQEVPPDRFTFETVFREHEPQRKWYGNFINDHDTFDHKFFKKALSSPNKHLFQPVNITNAKAWDNLADVTLSLWKAGLDISFWAHHTSQVHKHELLLLPPYQFEKSSHWLELKKPPKEDPSANPTARLPTPNNPESLLTFVGHISGDKEIRSRFRINTTVPEYEEIMKGHVISHTAPICPITVQLDLVITALQDLLSQREKVQPHIFDTESRSPLCFDESLPVWIEFETSTTVQNAFRFKIYSSKEETNANEIIYTTGTAQLLSADNPQSQLELSRYDRLTGHRHCLDLLNDPNADEILQGRTIYKVFADVVDYSKQYQGLQKLVAKGQRSAGRVLKSHDHKSLFDAYLSDNFCQVAGVWINCMTDIARTDMYLARGFERWLRSPKLGHQIEYPASYDVMAYHDGPVDNNCVTDIFIFHPTTAELLEVILGFHFVKVARHSFSKMITRLTPGSKSLRDVRKDIAFQDLNTIPPLRMPLAEETFPTSNRMETKSVGVPSGILQQLKAILGNLTGIEQEQISEESELAYLGIDSLMGMELVREIEDAFKICISPDEVAGVASVSEVLKCIIGALKFPSAASSENSCSEYTIKGPAIQTLDRTMPVTSIDSESREPSSSYARSGGIITQDSSNETQHKDSTFTISLSAISEAFQTMKSSTDTLIADCGCDDYVVNVLPLQIKLTTTYILEAFEKLGCSLSKAQDGEDLIVSSALPEYVHFISQLFKVLEKETGLLAVHGNRIMRMNMPYPSKTSQQIKDDLLRTCSKHNDANNLIVYVGENLADVLCGKTDGIKLIFGSEKGRELVSRFYRDWIMNRIFYKQMENFIQCIANSLPISGVPLKILELGAGTGGTTTWLVQLLTELNHPIEYTFTDLSPSLVAAARKRFGKYMFMKFRTHNIEEQPIKDLLNTQHIVIATNAIHATPNLVTSLTNIKKALLPNGVLMMLEMIEPLCWTDMIFGMFKGWWSFNDGRTHALTPQNRWKNDLHASGYGYVNWTEGARPENTINKLIIGVVCEANDFSQPWLINRTKGASSGATERQNNIERYIHKYTLNFTKTLLQGGITHVQGSCVLVTGATGSVGCHIVAALAALPTVKRVICLNRQSNHEPRKRQFESLISKGICDPERLAGKLMVLESDAAKAYLGLPLEIYQELARSVTHIIHNAWPMSFKRPLKNFEPQFQVMRNLIDIAQTASSRLPPEIKFTFQFVSSVAVVGHYPIWKEDPCVPEERMPIDAVFPMGYAEAKYVCEKMLDKTLHHQPDRFRVSVVRLGQVAASKKSGYWNTHEHLSFLWKSSQCLNHLPQLPGLVSWTPVDDVAGALVDLAFTDTPYPVYNIDNPVRQPWSDILAVLADSLSIPQKNIIPFEDWIDLVRNATDLPEQENPTVKLLDFLCENFFRMSCGGLLLETTKAQGHSPTLGRVGPV
ncbi:hypothetical protein DV736_g5986, partial [Chaetothyriales sp. CBS 134916]